MRGAINQGVGGLRGWSRGHVLLRRGDYLRVRLPERRAAERKRESKPVRAASERASGAHGGYFCAANEISSKTPQVKGAGPRGRGRPASSSARSRQPVRRKSRTESQRLRHVHPDRHPGALPRTPRRHQAARSGKPRRTLRPCPRIGIFFLIFIL